MAGIRLKGRLAVSLLIVVVLLGAGAGLAISQNAKLSQSPGEISLSYYQGYEKDNWPMSNPVEARPLDPFYIGGVQVFEATVAVNVTGPSGPAKGVGVSLIVWNATYERTLNCVSNAAGCAMFYFTGPVSPASADYQYRAFLTVDPNVTTEARLIKVSRGYYFTNQSDYVTITLNRQEIVLNDRGEQKFLRLNYSVVPNRNVASAYYVVSGKDFYANLFSHRDNLNLTKNSTAYIQEDIPMNASNLYEIVHADLLIYGPSVTGYHTDEVLLMLPMEVTAPLARGICDLSTDLTFPGLRPVESGKGTIVTVSWPMLPAIEGGASRPYRPQPPGTEPEFWNYIYFGEVRSSTSPSSFVVQELNITTSAANATVLPPAVTPPPSYTPTPSLPPSIPEPSTFVIAGLGLLCLLGYVLYARKP